MYNLGADSNRGVRPDKDRINISFARFQLLRSIAYAAKSDMLLDAGDKERLNGLLNDLDKLEISELLGAMKTNV